MLVMDVGMSRLLTSCIHRKLRLRSWSPTGIATLASELHPSKALASMLVTDAGIATQRESADTFAPRVKWHFNLGEWVRTGKVVFKPM